MAIPALVLRSQPARLRSTATFYRRFWNWQEVRLVFQDQRSVRVRSESGRSKREGFRKQFRKLCGKGVRRLTEERGTFFAGFHDGGKLLTGSGAHEILGAKKACEY